VAGRRVVSSSDGGRMRLRETKGGPQPTKGRQRSTGAGRDPQGLIMYVVDAEGKREASLAPVRDATLKGPDAVFALLRTYVQRLSITQADQVLCGADGAPWIGQRGPLLVQAFGLAATHVHALLDFYHAVQHLAQVAALRTDWSAQARRRWRPHQPACCCGARWSRSLPPCGRSVGVAIARRSARSEPPASSTRAAGRRRSSWP